MKKKALSEKRLEILETIDSHGIITRKQLLKYVKVADLNLRKGLKVLEDNQFISTYKLYRGYAHYITKKGSEYVGKINFGYVKSGKEPNLAILEHNLLINDCILQAIDYIKEHAKEKELSEIEIITERQQLSDIYLDLDWKRRTSTTNKQQIPSRIPDFLLKFKYGGTAFIHAYEVELSQKNKARLRAKFHWFKEQIELGNYTHIIYMYNDESVKRNLLDVSQQIGLKLNFREIEEEN